MQKINQFPSFDFSNPIKGYKDKQELDEEKEVGQIPPISRNSFGQTKPFAENSKQEAGSTKDTEQRKQVRKSKQK